MGAQNRPQPYQAQINNRKEMLVPMSFLKNLSLAEYPAVVPWIERVKALPNFSPMPSARTMTNSALRVQGLWM
jgi:glutathione S-transferase